MAIDLSIELEPNHEEQSESVFSAPSEQQLNAKKVSSQKLGRYDSLDCESGFVHAKRGYNSKGETDWPTVLHLAFQSIGIVYGDIGTSPLYVYSGTFTDGIKHNDDILGVLSLIFYTITLIPLIKYVFIVLRANDNGNGGTFALYSLICRYANVGLIPSQQVEDHDVSNFQLETPNKEVKRASNLKSILENSRFAKFFLLFATMLGTSMVIGDGILSPCISVLSAVGGIKEATSAMTEGTEALFADVGHFTVKSIQISMCVVTYPAIVLAYFGQASFLRKHNDLVADAFFKSVPHNLYWPVFVVSVMAAIIASQAMISGSFSIIQQSLSLGCFPRVKIVHTSAKYEGQVFIPELNYLLMIACVSVTLGFRTTAKIGNAYGIAVVCVECLTSAFLVLIMIMIWKKHIIFVISFVLVVCSVEYLYLSAVLYKFTKGGYLPLVFALILMTIMYVWNNVYRQKYYYELDHKISPEKLKQIIALDGYNVVRIPGLALFYSELVEGIPPIFNHYVTNVPALHDVLVFVSIKSLPISKVPAGERFRFRLVEPRGLNVYRCVARYGYIDVRVYNDEESFEKILVDKLKEFIKNEDENRDGEREIEMEKDIEVVEKAWTDGVVHFVGENEVVARKGARFANRVLINYLYGFMKKNLRRSDQIFDIPHKRMVKVGMTYEL